MDIVFASDKLRDLIHDEKKFKKQYGANNAKRLRVRLNALLFADNLSIMRNTPGRCHELKGDREGQLAVDLHKGYRLIFEPANEPVPTKPDGGLDWQQVTAIRILEVEDYHGG